MKKGKNVFSLAMAIAVGFCSSLPVSAVSQSRSTESENQSFVCVEWNSTFESLSDVMGNADICVIGTVLSQEIEERMGVYFTCSYVAATDGTVYPIFQTGAIINGEDTWVPYDAELLERGEEYFLCLDQVESDNFGTYYLIMGGNQGYGKYDSSSGYVQMINDVDRSVFDTFSIETPESVSIDCISNFVDNTRVETRAITPAEGHKWNASSLTCYISPTISSMYGSGVYNAIVTGAKGWNATNAPTVSASSNVLSYNISIDMGDCGTTGWDGISYYSWSGSYYTHSEIVLNTTYLSDYLSETGLWQALACHEMGHSLGLDHNTTTTLSVMQEHTVDYYDYVNGTRKIKTPQTVDKVGMNTIYS